MRHFIAYHNTEKMGRQLHESGPLRLLTNKQANHLLEQSVWFVTGERVGGRQYSLESVFQLSEVGDANEDGFKRFASGPGHVFLPPIPIKDMDWFPEVLRATGALRIWGAGGQKRCRHCRVDPTRGTSWL